MSYRVYIYTHNLFIVRRKRKLYTSRAFKTVLLTMTLKGLQVDNNNFKTSTESDVEENFKYGDDAVKSSLCCLQGCLAASSVGFSFFVALPTGILLVIYSQKDSDPKLLITGIVLIILPLIILLIVITLCFNKHRLKRAKIKHVDQTANVQDVNTKY